MKLWRCQNEECSTDPHGRLIFDFMADEPVCPTCGADGRTPEGHNVVIPRTVIHLLVKDKAGPLKGERGRYRLACQPEAKRVAGQFTTVPSAATCPLCHESDLYKTAYVAAKPVEANEVLIGTKLVG